MDKLRARPRNAVRQKRKRFIYALLIVIVIVFAVAMIPVAFLYFAGLSK